MWTRLGTLALAAVASSAVLLPGAAHAQEAYGYATPYSYYDHDRNWDRHERHEWRERERRERREAWREQHWRDHEWREHQWREGERPYGAYYGPYPPSSYYRYGYDR